jgi:hypothetical protein
MASKRTMDVVEERYIGRLPIILGALCLLLLSSALAFAVMAHRPETPEGPRLAESAFVVVFEWSPCEPCEKFRDRIAKAYLKTEAGAKAPIRYFDITDGGVPKRFRVKSEVYTAPTIVVFDPFGREFARYTGLPESPDVLTGMVRSAVRKAERDAARSAK